MSEPCIFLGCVSTDRHRHGGFYGGYANPDDPEGPPIPFTSEPAPGVRDYNGALLAKVPTDEWFARGISGTNCADYRNSHDGEHEPDCLCSDRTPDP